MARPKGSKDQSKRKTRPLTVTDNMIGKKYCRLQILEVFEAGKSPKVKAECDCGKIKIVRAHDVRYGRVLSCGCYHHDELSKRQIKPNNESAKRRLFNSYKFGAEVRNIQFNLTFDQVYEIANNTCYYCDLPPERTIETIGGEILVNGIDRVENHIGYQLDNCVTCCKTCNLHKNDIPTYIIEKAYEFIKRKKS